MARGGQFFLGGGIFPVTPVAKKICTQSYVAQTCRFAEVFSTGLERRTFFGLSIILPKMTLDEYLLICL